MTNRIANDQDVSAPVFEPLLTSKEVSEVLRIPVIRLYELIGAGVIKGVRVGRRWRVAPADLRAFIDSGGLHGVSSSALPTKIRS